MFVVCLPITNPTIMMADDQHPIVPLSSIPEAVIECADPQILASTVCTTDVLESYKNGTDGAVAQWRKSNPNSTSTKVQMAQSVDFTENVMDCTSLVRVAQVLFLVITCS